MSRFSERFKLLKEEKSCTLKEMSQELNISITNLSYYLNGREPSYDTLCAIANYFGSTTDYLLGFSDFKTHSEELHDIETKQQLRENAIHDLIGEKGIKNLKDLGILLGDLSDLLKALILEDNAQLPFFYDLTENLVDMMYTIYANREYVTDKNYNIRKNYKSSKIDVENLFSQYDKIKNIHQVIIDMITRLLYIIIEDKSFDRYDKEAAKEILSDICCPKTKYSFSPYERHNPLHEVENALLKKNNNAALSDKHKSSTEQNPTSST